MSGGQGHFGSSRSRGKRPRPRPPAVAVQSKIQYPISNIPSRSGAALLEAVLALTLFVMGVAMLGATIHNAISATDKMNRRGRAMALAESLLAEIRAGYLVPDDRAEGDFKPQFPDCRYRLAVEDHRDVPNLRHVTVTVGWDRDAAADGGGAGDQIDPARSVELTAWLYLEPPAEESAEEPTEGTETPTGQGGVP